MCIPNHRAWEEEMQNPKDLTKETENGPLPVMSGTGGRKTTKKQKAQQASTQHQNLNPQSSPCRWDRLYDRPGACRP